MQKLCKLCGDELVRNRCPRVQCQESVQERMHREHDPEHNNAKERDRRMKTGKKARARRRRNSRISKNIFLRTNK